MEDLLCAWPDWFPRCSQWVKHALVEQATKWINAMARGDLTLRDWACYENAMSAIEWCRLVVPLALCTKAETMGVPLPRGARGLRQKY